MRLKTKIFAGKKFWVGRNPIFLLLLFSLLVRAVFFFVFHVSNKPESDFYLHIFSPESDARGYHQMALNLLETCSFKGDNPTVIFDFFTLDSIRTPGYPIFLAAVYFVFGISPAAVVLFQIILNLLSVLLVYRITIQLFENRKMALLAAFLFSMDIYSIYYVFELYSETLFLFILLFSVLILIKSIAKNNRGQLIFGGILLGYTALIRPVAILLPVVFIASFLVSNNQSFSHKLKKSAVFIFSFLIVISSWMIRNQVEYKHFTFSAISSRNLYSFNAVITESNLTGKSVQQVENEFKTNVIQHGVSLKNNPFDNAAIIQKLGIDYIKANRYSFVEQHVQGMINMFASTGHRQILSRFGVDVSKGGEKYSPSKPKRIFLATNYRETIFASGLIFFLMLCYLSSLAGIYFLFEAKEHFILILFLGIILYFTFLTGIAGSPRLRIPLVPFYCILAGYGFFKPGTLISKIQIRKNQ